MKVIVNNKSIETLIEKNSLEACESDYGEDMICYKGVNLISIKDIMVDDALNEFKISWTLDYKRSQLFFYIHNENNIQLVIEVFPKRLSYEEKNNMLSIANREIGQDGYSDYYRLLNTFDEIDKILNSIYPTGIFNFYNIELSEEEKTLFYNLN